MGTRYEIPLGPYYCSHCGEYTLHKFVSAKALDYCVSIFELPMFFLGKKNRFMCVKCQTEYKIDSEKKEFLRLFKDSGLFNPNNYNALWDKIYKIMEEQNIEKIGKYSEEMKDLILTIKEKVSWQYKLPDVWYEHFCYFVYDSLKQEMRINNRLYGKTECYDNNSIVSEEHAKISINERLYGKTETECDTHPECNIVGVRFSSQNSGCYYYLCKGKYDLNTSVLVETSKGDEYVKVVFWKHYQASEKLPYDYSLLKHIKNEG